MGVYPRFYEGKFNVHEVVSTIMMNWVAYWTIYYAVPAYLKADLETESRPCRIMPHLKAPFLSDMFGGSYAVNLGLFIAVLVVIIALRYH